VHGTFKAKMYPAALKHRLNVFLFYWTKRDLTASFLRFFFEKSQKKFYKLFSKISWQGSRSLYFFGKKMVNLVKYANKFGVFLSKSAEKIIFKSFFH
jgi:hypothetical protein